MDGANAARAMEELFAATAVARLPVDTAERVRLESGILCYKWRSPCDEIGELCLYLDEAEITMGVKFFHSHIDGWRLPREQYDEADLRLHIVEEAVTLAANVLAGEMVFIQYFGSDGPSGQAGMCKMEQWPTKSDHMVPGQTRKAYNWLGPIPSML